jgi:hypothetical protein
VEESDAQVLAYMKEVLALRSLHPEVLFLSLARARARVGAGSLSRGWLSGWLAGWLCLDPGRLRADGGHFARSQVLQLDTLACNLTRTYPLVPSD